MRVRVPSVTPREKPRPLAGALGLFVFLGFPSFPHLLFVDAFLLSGFSLLLLPAGVFAHLYLSVVEPDNVLGIPVGQPLRVIGRADNRVHPVAAVRGDVMELRNVRQTAFLALDRSNLFDFHTDRLAYRPIGAQWISAC
jgi:hypothetical protein